MMLCISITWILEEYRFYTCPLFTTKKEEK